MTREKWNTNNFLFLQTMLVPFRAQISQLSSPLRLSSARSIHARPLSSSGQLSTQTASAKYTNSVSFRFYYCSHLTVYLLSPIRGIFTPTSRTRLRPLLSVRLRRSRSETRWRTRFLNRSEVYRNTLRARLLTVVSHRHRLLQPPRRWLLLTANGSIQRRNFIKWTLASRIRMRTCGRSKLRLLSEKLNCEVPNKGNSGENYYLLPGKLEIEGFNILSLILFESVINKACKYNFCRSFSALTLS